VIFFPFANQLSSPSSLPQDVVLEILQLAVAMLLGGNPRCQRAFFGVMQDRSSCVGEDLLQRLSSHLAYITTQIKEGKKTNHQRVFTSGMQEAPADAPDNELTGWTGGVDPAAPADGSETKVQDPLILPLLRYLQLLCEVRCSVCRYPVVQRDGDRGRERGGGRRERGREGEREGEAGHVLRNGVRREGQQCSLRTRV
jgi:hypothetical protein